MERWNLQQLFLLKDGGCFVIFWLIRMSGSQGYKKSAISLNFMFLGSHLKKLSKTWREGCPLGSLPFGCSAYHQKGYYWAENQTRPDQTMQIKLRIYCKHKVFIYLVGNRIDRIWYFVFWIVGQQNTIKHDLISILKKIDSEEKYWWWVSIWQSLVTHHPPTHPPAARSAKHRHHHKHFHC